MQVETNNFSPSSAEVLLASPKKGTRKRFLLGENSAVTKRTKTFAESRNFALLEPNEWFPLIEKAENRVAVRMPPEIGKVKRVIYIFRNVINGNLLIGKTGGTLRARISRYLTQINNGKKTKLPFILDARENPGKMEVGLLYQVGEEEDINECETQCIEQKCAAGFKLYNQNKGGGGGQSHDEEKPGTYVFRADTPDKRYIYSLDEDGNLRIQFSPEFYRTNGNLKFCVYGVKDTKSGKNYYGVTARRPDIRAREHAGAANRGDCTSALHKEMRLRGEDFTFGVIPIENDPEKITEDHTVVTTSSEAERFIIHKRRSLVSQNGFNMNGGGGGPVAKSQST